MIHHDVRPRAPLEPCSAGHTPRLIETRGRATTDHRLFGKPAVSWHVECCRCGIGTAPAWSQVNAEARWAAGAGFLIPVSTLPAERVALERALAAA